MYLNLFKNDSLKKRQSYWYKFVLNKICTLAENTLGKCLGYTISHNAILRTGS